MPVPPPGEALIRVLMAGICNTDLEIARGYMGFQGTPGHEFVGVVEACEDPAWVGRRVVGEINCGCGACDDCRRGDPRHCMARTVLGILGRDGTFAEYTRLPLRNLHAVPEALPDELAVFTEPLAAACEILEQVPVTSETRVLVLGDGKLGSLCGQVLHATGARVLVCGHHPRKLGLLRQAGLDTTDTLPEGRGWDVVVEATGTEAGLLTALSRVRPRGTVVLKTTVAQPSTIHLAPIVIDEIRVVGSRCGPFAPALESLGRIDPRPMVDATYPLPRAREAFEHAARAGALKVLIDCR